MSTDASVGMVPQFDRSDRMRKALQVAHVGVQEMADYLGVSRASVGNWINGKVRPSKQTMRLWAIRCGVPLVWLETGEAPATPGPDDDGWAHWESNPEPAVSVLRLVRAA